MEQKRTRAHDARPTPQQDDPGEPHPWCVEFTAPSKTGGIGGALEHCDWADMGITEHSVERLEDAPRPFASGLIGERRDLDVERTRDDSLVLVDRGRRRGRSRRRRLLRHPCRARWLQHDGSRASPWRSRGDGDPAARRRDSPASPPNETVS